MKKEKRARARRTGAQAAESGAARPAGGAGKTLRALGFAQKLTLAMLLVLAMALSLGGAVVLAGNFDDALNEAGQQAEVQHLLQCYALESDLLDVAARGETVTDSQGVDVTVGDTGCGIPAAALARVTEPFYMVDKSRARAGGGSGMGLALCEKIAALHGGRLQIESVEGEGTAVTVRLPAADGKEGGAAV